MVHVTVPCYNQRVLPNINDLHTTMVMYVHNYTHTSKHQAIVVEDQFKKLAKAGAVVVHHRLSITKCLQNRIHLDEQYQMYAIKLLHIEW